MESLPDWNVVVTVHAGGYRRARRLLEDFAPVGRSEYFNVLVMQVADRQLFMDALQARVDEDPAIGESLDRDVAGGGEAVDGRGHCRSPVARGLSRPTQAT